MPWLNQLSFVAARFSKVAPAISRRAGSVAALLASATVLACDHSEPFQPPALDTVGPREVSPQVTRLTFNPTDDRDPFVFGEEVYFSRLETVRVDGDRCLSALPLEGGTLTLLACADGEANDQNKDARLQPAVSPDGARIAYVVEQSRAQFTDRSPNLRRLVVAPLNSLEDTATVLAAVYRVPSGEMANDFRSVEWITASRLRFMAGQSSFNSNSLDTVFVPMGVHEYDLEGEGIQAITGAENAYAFTSKPNGGIWFVEPSDSSVIWSLDIGEEPVRYSRTSGFGRDAGHIHGMATVDGFPTVMRHFFSGEPLLGNRFWITWVLPDGTFFNVWRFERTPDRFVPRAVVGVPGRRAFIVDLVRGDAPNDILQPVNSAGGDLWLFEF